MFDTIKKIFPFKSKEPKAVSSSSLSAPVSSVPLDKRTCPRYRAAWHVQVQSSDYIGEATTEDISFNGMRIFFTEPVTLPSDIMLTFNIPDGHGPTSLTCVRVHAKIAHSISIAGGLRVGVLFQNIEIGQEAYGWALSTIPKNPFL